MENRTSKYFKYAVGEIVLVVIGILIALQINNWNENRKSSQQEQLYLNRLLEENNQDLTSFNNAINDLKMGVTSIEDLSAALNSKNSEDTTLIKAANNYFKYGSIYPIFASSTSTFDDLSSTGNLKIITNNALRNNIVQHYAKHKQVAERIQIAVDWALPLDAPFTYQQNIMKFEPSTAFLFPHQPSTELATELRENKVYYISNAAAHHWINRDAIALIQDLIDKTMILKEDIVKEINQ